MELSRSQVIHKSLVEVMAEENLVHLGCDSHQAIGELGKVAAWFANTRDVVPVTYHSTWRALVISTSYRQALAVVNHAKDDIVAPGFRMWNSAAIGKQGSLRAVGLDPLSVQGIMSWNLFYIVIGNQNWDFWNALWGSVVGDTKMLAVNCNLFAQRSQFTYLE